MCVWSFNHSIVESLSIKSYLKILYTVKTNLIWSSLRRSRRYGEIQEKIRLLEQYGSQVIRHQKWRTKMEEIMELSLRRQAGDIVITLLIRRHWSLYVCPYRKYLQYVGCYLIKKFFSFQTRSFKSFFFALGETGLVRFAIFFILFWKPFFFVTTPILINQYFVISI